MRGWSIWNGCLPRGGSSGYRIGIASFFSPEHTGKTGLFRHRQSGVGRSATDSAFHRAMGLIFAVRMDSKVQTNPGHRTEQWCSTARD